MAAPWQVQDEAPGSKVVLLEHGGGDQQDRDQDPGVGRRRQARRVGELQPLGRVQVHPADEEGGLGEGL